MAMNTDPTGKTLLLIDGNPSHARVIEAVLVAGSESPVHLIWCNTLGGGLERLSDKGISAILLSLPESQGIETFDQVFLAASPTPILVLSSSGDEDIAKEAVRHGAQDYLLEAHVDSYLLSRAVRTMIERKASEDSLFIEKEHAQVTLNSIGDAVLSTDTLGNITYLNVAAENMTGWSRIEALGRPFAEVFRIMDGTSHEPVRNPMELAVQQNRIVGLTPNCILIRRDGFESAIEDSAAPIHDRNGKVTGAVMVFHDVTAALGMAIQMSHLAQHDCLTNLPNRILLKDRLTQAITLAHRNGHRLAVLFLDLDGFKHINDSLGHSVGDNLLQSIAGRLVAAVRHSDTVSRQGGDEFVILLSEIKNARDAAISAKKMLASLTVPHSIAEHNLHVTASIGLTTFPDDGEDAETLVKNADTAMYHAKASGRNNYQFFKKDMNVRAVERQALEEGLRYALERDEFELHYQPKVNLATGEIIGAEALLRWLHPDLGVLPPLQFVPIAEDSGLILPIGRWVLREACRQARAWLNEGLRPIPVGVNISSLEFRSNGFLEGVRDVLKDTRLEPSYLELEMTEGVLMQHADSTASMLKTLKIMGVHLTVDDFGTGYSSLSYLTRFPIDTLKVDQSFVQKITSDKEHAAIINAVISMAKSLKQRVLAEGVETLEQLAFLRAHACDEGQGYYFGAAMMPVQFAKLLKTGIAPIARQKFICAPS
jgi:diguanylate cyclase (GGDEF)-like protein/PAS domain S-box-containing protein